MIRRSVLVGVLAAALTGCGSGGSTLTPLEGHKRLAASPVKCGDSFTTDIDDFGADGIMLRCRTAGGGITALLIYPDANALGAVSERYCIDSLFEQPAYQTMAWGENWFAVEFQVGAATMADVASVLGGKAQTREERCG